MTSNLGRWGRALLVLPAACAAFTSAMTLYLTDGFAPASWSVRWAGVGLVVAAFGLSGPLALAYLISLGARRFPKGMVVVTLAALTYTVATFCLLMSLVDNERSSAVELLLYLPIYLFVLLVPFWLVTVLVHVTRSRGWMRSGTRISRVGP